MEKMDRTKIQFKTSYRDQLIRELQHLQATDKTEIEFSKEVKDLMDAVKRDQARIQDDGAHHVWRRWLPGRIVRCDDVLSASDLYLLEVTLIEYLDAEDLKIRVTGFRDMLSHLLTKESYGALSNRFQDISNTKNTSPDELIGKLRSEARALLSRIYRRYEGVPAVEGIRWKMAKRIFYTTLATMLLPGYFIWIDSYRLIFAVGLAGVIGAAISTVERLYEFDPRHEPFKTWLAIESGGATLSWSPPLGFIFALVMLLLLQANLAGGLLFPSPDCWTFLGSKPCAEGVDITMAKLLTWGFIAGWGERIVPDVLNKLTPQATANVRSR